MDASLFSRLLDEEYSKLLKAKSKDVHDESKTTTLPISREIAQVYVLDEKKAPWFIDLLNINLNNHSLTEAVRRINLYMSTIKKDGVRITENWTSACKGLRYPDVCCIDSFIDCPSILAKTAGRYFR